MKKRTKVIYDLVIFENCISVDANGNKKPSHSYAGKDFFIVTDNYKNQI